MNQRLTRILCVDDEPCNLELLEALLNAFRAAHGRVAEVFEGSKQ